MLNWTAMGVKEELQQNINAHAMNVLNMVVLPKIAIIEGELLNDRKPEVEVMQVKIK
jgi:hypothetical protein